MQISRFFEPLVKSSYDPEFCTYDNLRDPPSNCHVPEHGWRNRDEKVQFPVIGPVLDGHRGRNDGRCKRVLSSDDAVPDSATGIGHGSSYDGKKGDRNFDEIASL